jgi:hypothetical protein
MDREPTPAPPPRRPGEEACPWCGYRGERRRVLTHMEYEHHPRWQEVALSPPIAGGVW